MVKRTIIFIVLAAIIWIGEVLFDSRIQPESSTKLAVAAMNGGDREASNLRESNVVTNHRGLAASGLTVMSAVLCFGFARGITSPRR